MYLHNMNKFQQNSRNPVIPGIWMDFGRNQWRNEKYCDFLSTLAEFFFDFSNLHIQNCCKFLELSISLWEDAID